MKNFIEVTDQKDTKALLNINQIFKVQSIDVKGVSKCRIDLMAKGFNNFPYQFIDTKESYEEVLKLIELSL